MWIKFINISTGTYISLSEHCWFGVWKHCAWGKSKRNQRKESGPTHCSVIGHRTILFGRVTILSFTMIIDSVIFRNRWGQVLIITSYNLPTQFLPSAVRVSEVSAWVCFIQYHFILLLPVNTTLCNQYTLRFFHFSMGPGFSSGEHPCPRTRKPPSCGFSTATQPGLDQTEKSKQGWGRLTRLLPLTTSGKVCKGEELFKNTWNLGPSFTITGCVISGHLASLSLTFFICKIRLQMNIIRHLKPWGKHSVLWALSFCPSASDL